MRYKSVRIKISVSVSVGRRLIKQCALRGVGVKDDMAEVRYSFSDLIVNLAFIRGRYFKQERCRGVASGS